MFYGFMILRELRRLFFNRTTKRVFTIIILFFAIYMFLNFLGVLPARPVFASEDIFVYMNAEYGKVSSGGVSDSSVTNTLGEGQTTSDTYTYSTADTFYTTINDGSYKPCFIFTVTGGQHYYLTCNTNTNVLALFTETLTNSGYGIGVSYQGNYTNQSEFNIVAPSDGYIILYCSTYNSLTNPFTCYYTFEESVTSEDIGIITNTIQEQGQIIENTITDNTVDENIVDILPEDNLQNPYSSNVDSIFTKIYNAFTQSQYRDITVTIPFTNKIITIGPGSIWGGYTAPMLPQALKTLINTFWWYIVSRFIVLDILNIIEKIKNGKVDKVAESNVKEDML